MTHDEILTGLTKLIEKHSTVKVINFSEEIRLLEDLGILGDDANEFFGEFSNAYGVNMSGVNLGKYFPAEASSEMHYFFASEDYTRRTSKLLKFLAKLERGFWGLFADKVHYKTVTIGNLLAAAKTGQWSDR